MTVNVYEQYFEADCTVAGVLRRGVLVMLISDSAAGSIRYEAAVTFFPHSDADDFAISYDAYRSTVLYEAPGRRSKKREKTLLAVLRDKADLLAGEIGGRIFWDRPLRGARTG